MTDAYYTTLPNRAVLEIAGEDVREFLQGLITQDINLLDTQPLIYSALLTPQGKIAFDFFIYADGESICLECEGHKADALSQTLKKYILRRKITIKTLEKQVIALWSLENTLKTFSYPRDPRHLGLGYRIIIDEDTDFEKKNDSEEKEFKFYDTLRIGLGIPDGSRDIALAQDTIADIGLDKFNGVSWTKGCYMGQEITSRVHHRGLSKRGLYSVTIQDAPLPPFTDILVDGNLIGEMRSSQGNMGLAILRHDSVKLAENTGLTVPQ